MSLDISEIGTADTYEISSFVTSRIDMLDTGKMNILHFFGSLPLNPAYAT